MEKGMEKENFYGITDKYSRVSGN